MDIARTMKNGKTVCLYADCHLDTETAYYIVSCNGTRFEFKDFAPAARVYKEISRVIEDDYNTEMGRTLEGVLSSLARSARALGYKVEEK